MDIMGGTAPVHPPGRIPAVYIMVPEFDLLLRDAQLQQLIITGDTVLPAGNQQDDPVILFQWKKFLQQDLFHILRIPASLHSGTDPFPSPIDGGIRPAMDDRRILRTVSVPYEFRLEQGQLAVMLLEIRIRFPGYLLFPKRLGVHPGYPLPLIRSLLLKKGACIPYPAHFPIFLFHGHNTAPCPTIVPTLPPYLH